MTAQKKTPPIGGSRGVQNQNQLNNNLTNDYRRGKDFDSSIDDEIGGQQEGSRLVQRLRGNIVEPDLLFARIREIADDPATLRGFCRAIQKSLERGGGN